MYRELKYYYENRDVINENRRINRRNEDALQKEQRRIKGREYYQLHKEEIRIKHKQYRDKNKEKIKKLRQANAEYYKAYYRKHKDRIKELNRIRNARNPNYLEKNRIRQQIYRANRKSKFQSQCNDKPTIKEIIVNPVIETQTQEIIKEEPQITIPVFDYGEEETLLDDDEFFYESE